MNEWLKKNKRPVSVVVGAVAVGIAYAAGGMDAVREVLRILGSLGLAPESPAP
jgi:P2-related tail formation protein